MTAIICPIPYCAGLSSFGVLRELTFISRSVSRVVEECLLSVGSSIIRLIASKKYIRSFIAADKAHSQLSLSHSNLAKLAVPNDPGDREEFKMKLESIG